VSYSHAADDGLARAVQRGLLRLTRAWYRPPALRVFRDKTSLAANPDLWATIESALGRSRYFVLLASPQSAQSPWVQREVAYWQTRCERDTFLIALIDGHIRWDDTRGDFDWDRTTALPVRLRGWFAREPLWVDLSWARTESERSLTHTRFRDDIGTLAAPIHGRPKDELDSEDVRQQLRARRLGRTAVAVLALLFVVALTAAGIAVVERNSALDQARVANARQLAALAVANIGTQLDLAQLYAVAAYRMDPDPQTLSALFQTVTASPHLVRALPVGVHTTVLAGAGVGHVVAAGTTDGKLLRWDLDHNAVTQVQLGTAAIAEVAIDGDGRRIVAADGSKLFIWTGTNDTKPIVRPVHRPTGVSGADKYLAISPSGNTIAAIDEVATGQARLAILDGATGQQRRGTVVPSAWQAIGLPDDATLNAQGGEPIAGLTQLAVSSLKVVSRGPRLNLPGDGLGGCCGFSTDARFVAWAKVDSTHVMPGNPNNPYSGTDEFFSAAIPIAEPDRFALSPDGTTVAAAGGGALYAARFDGNAPLAAQQLSGTGNVDAISFVGGGSQLVSATGTSLLLWDLSQASRITAGPAVQGTSAAEAGDQPLISISPDGNRLALSGLGTDNLLLEDLGASPATREPASKPLDGGVPVWSRDGTGLLLLAPGDKGYGAVRRTSGRFAVAWPEPNPNTPVAARMSADGQRVAVVSDHGDVQVRNFADGTVLSSVRGEQEQPPDDGLRPPAAISADLTKVATVRPDHSVWLTDPATGQQQRLPGSAAVTVAYADDRLLVARADNSLDVWTTIGDRLLRTIPPDAGYAPVLAAIPNSRLVARLTGIGTIGLWNVDTGDLLGTVTLPDSRAATNTVLAGTPDGRELVSATANGVVERWQLRPDAWIRAACASAGRNLTADEWRRRVNDTVPDNLACTP
jgi:WD40 repeat protein